MKKKKKASKIHKATVLIKNDKVMCRFIQLRRQRGSAASHESNTFNDSGDKVVIWKSTNIACVGSGLFVFYLLM